VHCRRITPPYVAAENLNRFFLGKKTRGHKISSCFPLLRGQAVNVGIRALKRIILGSVVRHQQMETIPVWSMLQVSEQKSFLTSRLEVESTNMTVKIFAHDFFEREADLTQTSSENDSLLD